MAQFKKEEIRKRILLAAKEEFMESGFLNASMRRIAKKSQVSVSNMYNYFQNKDELFEHLVIKVYEDIFNENDTKRMRMVTTSIENFETDLTLVINRIAKYVSHHQEVFKLLLIKSSGSKYANFRDELQAFYYRIELSAAEKKFITYPHVFKRRPSEDLIKNICSLYINLFEKYLKEEWCEIELIDRLNELNQFILKGMHCFLE